MKRVFILFKGARYTIKAEAHCRKLGLACRVMPVPRQVSSECGMSLEITSDLVGPITLALTEQGIEFSIAEVE